MLITWLFFFFLAAVTLQNWSLGVMLLKKGAKQMCEDRSRVNAVSHCGRAKRKHQGDGRQGRLKRDNKDEELAPSL